MVQSRLMRVANWVVQDVVTKQGPYQQSHHGVLFSGLTVVVVAWSQIRDRWPRATTA